MASVYGFTIKSIKKFKGRDFDGCQGYIWHENAKIGWYNDSGDGGCLDIDLIAVDEKKTEYKQLLNESTEKYFKEFPLKEPFDVLKPDEELFITELLALINREKVYKNLNKKGYPFMIVFTDQSGYYENHVGFTSETDANNYAAREKLSGYTIYKSLNDFIIS